MKRIILTFTILLLTIAAAEAQSRKEYDKMAKKFQHYYNAGQPDSLYLLYSDRVKDIMPLDKTKAMFARMKTDYSKMKAVSYMYKDEHFTYYKASYEQGAMLLVLLINKEHKVQSYRFAPYDANAGK